MENTPSDIILVEGQVVDRILPGCLACRRADCPEQFVTVFQLSGQEVYGLRQSNKPPGCPIVPVLLGMIEPNQSDL
jgi:hypothetical protein